MWDTKLDKCITIILLIAVTFACGWRMGINKAKTTLKIVDVTKKIISIEYTDGSIHQYEYN